MNFRELKHHFISEIAGRYATEEALPIFHIVMEYLGKWSRSELFNSMEKPVSPDDIHVCYHIIDELKAGKPVQYILGETVFYGLKFKVNPAVLIPRPETEELVDWMIREITMPQSHILDIGTGSGCIAVTLKKHLQKSGITALDISAGALDVARSNAILNAAEVLFIEANILTYNDSVKYDVIVSNPPYVKEDEKDEMHPNVLDHEPHLALFVANDSPLLFYEAIADFANKNLNKEGLLFFEVNEFLATETVDMLKSKGFKHIELKKDMQGKNRMIRCSLPG